MSNAKSLAKSLVKAVTATIGLILVVGGITASAQTSQFVSMMRNARVFFADGSASAPSIAFSSDTDTGFAWGGDGNLLLVNNAAVRHLWTGSEYRIGSGVSLGWSSNTNPNGAVADTVLCRGAANVIGIGGCTSSFPALKRSTTTLQVRLADDSNYGILTTNVNVANNLQSNSILLYSSSAPIISSGFGTSPSIVNSNGTAAFIVNVGTGGVATSGVIGLPAALNGWSCFANDRSNNTVTRQTATTTTTATFTAAAAWAASDILNISCFAY